MSFETLLNIYGINSQHFQLTFYNFNYLVAGSFALYGYLQQEGIEPGFQPNDIDIFLEGTFELPKRAKSYKEGKYAETKIQIIKALLMQYGFELKESDGKEKEYYTSNSNIKRIESFVHPNGKKIQIIVVKLGINKSLPNYIERNFDLSVCITHYDSLVNKFKTYDEENTKSKIMYIVNNSNFKPWRNSKYVKRGFVLVDRRPNKSVTAKPTATQTVPSITNTALSQEQISSLITPLNNTLTEILKRLNEIENTLKPRCFKFGY